MEKSTRNIIITIAIVAVILIIVVASRSGNAPAGSNAPGGQGTATSTAIADTTPAATSTPAATAPNGGNIATSTVFVTQADNGKIVNVKKGGRMVLMLGDDQWTISFSIPGVVERIVNIMPVRGSQGVYNVVGTGTTRISAQGRPNCAAGTMCPQYVVSFTATLNVVE